jgi:hypothetical protein
MVVYFTRVLNCSTRTLAKKSQFTQGRIEYKVFFLFDDPLKGSKSLKIFKISLTFYFDNVVTFIKIRSPRRKFSNSDSVEQKKKKHFKYVYLSINKY